MEENVDFKYFKNCKDKPSMYLMTHNKKVYDLLYFKGIIDDYKIELKSINNENVDNEELKIIVSVIK